MSIDYSESAIPKGKTRAEAKRLRDNLRKRIDAYESAKVKKRSGGRCEAILHTIWSDGGGSDIRCLRRATQVHHMIGGGMRAKGPSLLMAHKQHVCTECHRMITGDIGGKKLKLIQFGDLPHHSDRYWRVG